MLTTAEVAALDKKLRDCQRDAVSRVADYLEHDFLGKSMLVCLPTGAGKTGVIATICQTKSTGATLVLSPRRSVCDQLTKQVSGKFFDDLGIAVKSLNQVVTIGTKLKAGTIVIDTFQKLVAMDEAARSNYLLKFDLVIVDEGHSEPAPTWGRIVRSMSCRKIIVTATPYRNDLFQFDVGAINYCFTFKNAIHQGNVIAPEFLIVQPNEVVNKVLLWLDANPGLKCIVKCEDFYAVLANLQDFRRRNIDVLAFHDQFKTTNELGGMTQVPPDTASRAERVLVHQHKLDEGVDIPNAKLLVLSYAVSNGRELVQATGRVVRRSPGAPEVWDCAGGSNKVLWENYLEFDSYISEPDAWRLFLQSLDSATLINAYLSAFPKISYFGQNFRSTFDIESFDPDSQLKLPLASVCFMQVENDFAMPSFLDTLLWELRGQGELVRLCNSAFDLSVILSVTFDNSNFLKDELFFQPRIEVMVAKLVGRKLALLDSRSVDHSSRVELKTGQAVDVTSLLKLASRDKGRRTRETHARAVSATRNRAEGVSQRGQDLEGIVATQSNANYALSIAKVDNLDEHDMRTTSYYLGIGSGRVSDQKKRNFSLEGISNWIDEVVEVMDGQMESVTGLLSSFSLPLSGAAPSDILSVTVDLSDLATTILVRQGQREVEVSAGFHFEKVVNGKLHLAGIPLSISRDSENGRLVFSASHKWIVASDTADMSVGDDFVDWLNQQIFKALLAGGVSYLDGRYYLVTLPTQKGFDLLRNVLGRQFTAVPELQTNSLTEKGAPENGRFAAQSVFRILDELGNAIGAQDSPGLRRMKGEVADADIVLCTDLGTEAADFVISSARKLVYVHAKCGKAFKPRSSAGALAVVGGQAVKNIEVLVSKNIQLKFGNAALLKQPWKVPDSAQMLDRLRSFKDGSGRERVRSVSGRGSAIDSALKTLTLRRQSDACEKEIWIVVGRAFSLSGFVRNLAQGAEADPESLQAFQLVTAWSAAARDNDIALRFFVSP